MAARLQRFNAPSFEAYLKGEWQKTLKAADFDTAWREALGKGGVFSAAPAAEQPKTAAGSEVSYTKPTFDGTGDYVFMPYPSMQYHDGRGANKPWLLENPDPITKITWQSWVEIHPDTAAKLDVREGEIVELTSPHGKLRVQVYVYAGVRPDTFAMPLGLGHTEYGRYAKDRGVNALDLLGAADGQGFLPYVATKVSVTRTGDYRKVARVDGTPRQLGRGIIQSMPVAYAAKGMTPEESYKAAGREDRRGEHRTRAHRARRVARAAARTDQGRQLRGRIPSGAWRSICRAAPAARRASRRATPRTTSRRWARSRSSAAAR